MVLAAIAGLSVALLPGQTDPGPTTAYVPSDLSKAFPELDGVYYGPATFTTNNIGDAGEGVAYTVRGTVTGIGELEYYDDPAPRPVELGAIMPKPVLVPVDIRVSEITKGGGSDVGGGDTITVKLQGDLLEKTLSFYGEPRFEVGEQVIVHVSVSDSDMIERGAKYVTLGEFGKYRVQDDKAYNAKHPGGIPVRQALGEAE